MSTKADSVWFDKTVDLAQQLEDGTKLYFPFQGKSSETLTNVAGEQTSVFVTDIKGKININTAILSELDSLTGIGPANGQKIIENRQYSKIDDLLQVPRIGQKNTGKY